jgi:N-acetylneuraminic acid mutarotase
MNGGSMTSDWYYSKTGAPGGQQSGPFSWDQLCQLARSGALAPADLVWNPSLPTWTPAVQIPGLLPAAPFSAAPAAYSAPVQPGAAYQPYPGQPAAYPTGRSRSWLAWVIPLVAVVLVGAALGLYFGLRGDGDGDNGVAGTATGRTTTTEGAEDTTTEVVSTTTEAETTTTAEATTTTAAVALGTWTDVSPVGDTPTVADSHAMTYSPATGTMILFGGWNYDDSFNDTWAYEPAVNNWICLDPAGDLPADRAAAEMVYDPGTGTMIMFGGVRGGGEYTYYNDTWAYDPVANTWTDLMPSGDIPSVRTSHSMAYDPTSHRVILFGGWDGTNDMNDTYAYDPSTNTWTDLNPVGDVPSPRDGQGMAYDPGTGKIILFGGADATTTTYNETYAYDPSTNTWTDLNPMGDVPSGRVYICMVYDSNAGKMIVFGGWGGAAGLNDTWAYDAAANTWTDITPAGAAPSVRDSYAMDYDPVGGNMILFGGYDGTDDLGDTWVYGD